MMNLILGIIFVVIVDLITTALIVKRSYDRGYRDGMMEWKKK